MISEESGTWFATLFVVPLHGLAATIEEICTDGESEQKTIMD